MNKALLSRFLVALETAPPLSRVSPFAIDCDRSAGSGRGGRKSRWPGVAAAGNDGKWKHSSHLNAGDNNERAVNQILYDPYEWLC